MKRTILLDTGPLLEYALYCLYQRTPTRKRLLEKVSHIKSDRELNLFIDYVRQFPRRQTVSGVLAELYRHLCSFENSRVLFPGDRRGVWTDVRDLWKSLSIVEQLVPLSELEVSILAINGPVDVALT